MRRRQRDEEFSYSVDGWTDAAVCTGGCHRKILDGESILGMLLAFVGARALSGYVNSYRFIHQNFINFYNEWPLIRLFNRIFPSSSVLGAMGFVVLNFADSPT
jgi:hypothetical protein